MPGLTRHRVAPKYMRNHQYWVYMLTNKGNTTVYTGITNELQRRLFEHRTGLDPGSFAWKYQCWKLIWFEEHAIVDEAIRREKQVKKWHREWKDELVAASNPAWNDLSKDWDWSGWFDPNDPPNGYWRQHLLERWGGAGEP